VATIECDREFPVEGFFPQMAQTLDIATRHGSRRARPAVRPAAGCRAH
jgi:hypothetical protein